MDIAQFAINSLTEFFKLNNFKKNGKAWYKKNDHTYIVCQYQKSSFSNDFYLNFGIAFIELLKSEKAPLSPNDWHFDGRYERILGDNQFRINIDPAGDEAYLNNILSNITNNIQKVILPFLYQWSDIEYLKKNFPENFDSNRLWVKNIESKTLALFLHKL